MLVQLLNPLFQDVIAELFLNLLNRRLSRVLVLVLRVLNDPLEIRLDRYLKRLPLRVVEPVRAQSVPVPVCRCVSVLRHVHFLLVV